MKSQSINPGKLKNPYVYLEVPLKLNRSFIRRADAGKSGGALPESDRKLLIQVKLDDEGVVVDATLEGDNEPCATTWKTYQMMKDGEE